MEKKSKKMAWWGFACSLFLIFVILQIPANWLIAKTLGNKSGLNNISGNLWQGQANWNYSNLQGSITWKTRPFDLLLLRAAADIHVQTDKTVLNGIVAYGLGKKIIIRQLNGQISPESLRLVAPWQWPVNTIQLKQIQLNYKPQQGFNQAQGQLYWAGGELLYNFAQQQERMNVPSLQAALHDHNGNLQLDIRDQRNQKIANLSLDQNLMLDTQLTQRLLLNSQVYKGKAGLDTFVMSTRQPLFLKGAL